jgi:MFS family permease
MRSKVPTLAGAVPEIEVAFTAERHSVWSRIAAWWLAKNLRRDFWRYLAASFLHDSGMSIFFLLNNLYLLDLGFRENFLGWVAGAMALGSIAGSLPGGWIAHRFGLRKTMLLYLLVLPAVSGFRAVLGSGGWLAGLAFIGGAVGALWAVAVPPVGAQLTGESNRSFAFSVVFAAGIGFGAMAGLAGGHLPAWLFFLTRGHAAFGGKRAALLFACGMAALAMWPVSRLRFASTPVAERRHYPRSRFVFRFFPALAIWSFATGTFNPFFNAYFARGLGISVQRIGAIFAGGQIVQVLAILAAPAIYRRFGVLGGILYAQLACAAALEWLATRPHGWSAGIAYACFSGFQWMSQPSMYSLLMSKVQPGEQAGASALNLLVASGSQAVAAAAAGQAFARFGYPAVIAAAGVAIFAAAVLFRTLLAGCESPQPPDRIAMETQPDGIA